SGWCGAVGTERCPPPFLVPVVPLVPLLLGCFLPLALRRGSEQLGCLPAPGLSRRQVARCACRPGAPPPAFPNGCYRLLDSAQLPRGAVRSLALLSYGKQLAAFRSQNGQAYVVDAYCPHLGADLAAGGRIMGGCMECPFHGWQFQGEDGKCISILYAEKVPDFARVWTWPSCEVNGVLLVWYHCKGVGPTWAVPEQREITTKEWVFHGQTAHLVDMHIQVVSPLPPWGTSMPGSSPIVQFRDISCQLTHSGTSPPNYAGPAWCSVALQVGPGLDFLIFEHTFLGPGIILQMVTPLKPILQNVVHKIYPQKNMLAIIPKFILRVECIQFDCDITIWNNKQYLPKPLLIREDSTIQKRRRWYAQFYSEKSTRLLVQKEGLEW
ncbi:DAF36 desaturase, partial [Pandion haliaetus]|nr:DAF36 desaturase [Pandion haliaetus]